MKKALFLTLIMVAQCIICYGQNIDFCIYQNDSIEKSDWYIKGNIYQKDYLLFIDMLQTTHPSFLLNGMDDLLNNTIQEDYCQLKKCKDRNILLQKIESILSTLNDGHSGVVPEYNPNAIYPFVLFIDGNDVYLRAVNSEYSDFLGKKIISINGCPIFDVFDAFRPLISCDNDVFFKNNVCNYMQIKDMWDMTGIKCPKNGLKLVFSDKTSFILPTYTKKDIHLEYVSTGKQTNSPRQNTKSPFSYQILPEQNICYFQFNNCIDQNSIKYQYGNTSGNADEVQHIWEKYPRFDNFLIDMFDEIQENGISTLVIDVRNNGGGNSELCSQLLSYLAPIDSLKTYTSSIRFSKLWEQTYSQLSNLYKERMKGTNLEYHYGTLYNCTDLPDIYENSDENTISAKNNYFNMNRDTQKIFKGNVIFIQNAKTFSSAGMLITEAIDNGIGIVIGDRSSYRPCNYGDLLAWKLPNTAIKGVVSHKFFSRPNCAHCQDDYIEPKVLISGTWENVLKGQDPCWEWIINNQKTNK